MTTATAERESELATLRSHLEFAPKTAKHNPDITGWTTGAGNTICASCAARILARGCRIQAVPYWDNPVTCALCAPQSSAPAAGQWSIMYGGMNGDDYAVIGDHLAEYPVANLEPLGYKRSNATLIIAAPDMLAALELALAGDPDWRTAAAAAVAKATR